MQSHSSTWRDDPAAAAALAIGIAGAAALLGAWFFQYVVGLAPCPLCLEQRIPYYVAIPLAFLVAILARRIPRAAVTAGLIVLGLAMLIGAGLAAYHAGVEWKWWPGPQDCTGPITPFGQAGDLLNRLDSGSVRVVRCDEAAWRFLGLSLAGWNFLISLALVAVAVWGATRGKSSASLSFRAARDHGSSSVSQ